MRRALPFIAIGIVVLGLIVGAFFMFFSGKPSITVGEPNPFVGAGDREPTTTTTGPIEGAGTIVAPHLIRIADGPVAEGAVALRIQGPILSSSTPALEDTEVRYIERQNGNVFAFRLHDRTLTRISNKTLPGVVSAVWVPDGSRVFARFSASTAGTEELATYSLKADGGEGYFLEPNLSTVGITGSSTVFTLLAGSSGSVASVAPVGATAATRLFASPLAAITLQPFGANFVATTKASAEVGGYAFSVARSTGVFTRVLGPLTGLSTLPDTKGKYVLFSHVYRGKLILSVRDTVSQTTIQLPVATLAEKCVWTEDSSSIYCGVPTAIPQNLPDSWYQGTAEFSDRLWRIDMDSRIATLVVDPKTVADVAIDMISLTQDSAGDALVFTNRIDGSLWAYDF